MNIDGFLDYACKKYYEGNPIISDEEFDSLADITGYKAIGSKSESTDILHLYQMYSLQKVYDDEKKPIPRSFVETDKLDGAAIAVIYYKGKYVRALSRGDGIKGQDVTENVKSLVPNKLISPHADLIQITGEVVAPKTIPNARNYAAGALNLKSSAEFSTRDLTFIAYGMFPYYNNTWTKDMVRLTSMGIRTVFTANGNLSVFPTDGSVFRENNYKEFEDMGYTSKHPRAAFALKERPTGIVTTLLDVVWQVGKSGIVSPVAILEPVIIGEASISKATLHNMAYIEGLDLEIGCSVEVIRAGEIIPRVVRRVD